MAPAPAVLMKFRPAASTVPVGEALVFESTPASVRSAPVPETTASGLANTFAVATVAAPVVALPSVSTPVPAHPRPPSMPSDSARPPDPAALPTLRVVPAVIGRMVMPAALTMLFVGPRLRLSALTITLPVPVVFSRSTVESTMPVPPGPAMPVRTRFPAPVVRIEFAPE